MRPINPLKQRHLIRSLEKEYGLEKYSEIERSIIEFIAYRGKININGIVKDQYFRKVSLNTINRIVKQLRQEGIIWATKAHSGDRRIVYLSLKNEWNLD